MNTNPTQAAWQALEAHADRLRATRIDALFEQSPRRAEDYSVSAAGLRLHYGKQCLDDAARAALLDLAEAAALPEAVAQLYAGDTVNTTEQRAALHMALRAPDDTQWHARGERVDSMVCRTRDAFLAFAEDVRNGVVTAAGGERFTDVINIGIGGSDLGPRMVCTALCAPGSAPRAHFIANADPAERAAVLARCHPARTLVIVTSKTFTTQETMANAAAVRGWLAGALGEDAVAGHFAAVSTNLEAVRAFGIAEDRVFGFWDWVGGRYSLWSAVGLPIACTLGADAFRELLDGAHAMDRHFRNAPPARNLPVIAGLLGVWNRNLLGLRSQPVIPYAQRLRWFVPWLQQLEMESNGKSVTRTGAPVPRATTPPLWGSVGSNAQHAFFQMLHQGTEAHPVDFILPLRGVDGDAQQHRVLVANCLAQAAALMCGSGPDMPPHRRLAGNRPSSILLLPRLDARHLGALLALYEHRTFVQSVLWDVNAFDQWGVELGKRIAGTVDGALRGGDVVELDADTRALVQLALKAHD